MALVTERDHWSAINYIKSRRDATLQPLLHVIVGNVFITQERCTHFSKVSVLIIYLSLPVFYLFTCTFLNYSSRALSAKWTWAKQEGIRRR